MSLSEGKMFTIEALNRIEGFTWPEGATFGEVDGGRFVYFYSSDEGIQSAISSARIKQDDDPMTLHVQITREEFESVDGWVRNVRDGTPAINHGCVIDVTYCDDLVTCGVLLEDVRDDDSLDSWGNVRKWRYHKPQNQEANPDPESIETMIRRYKDAKENKRSAIDKLNQAQADVEQADALEDSLFMAIEAWAESHGFDIRVLSESEEKPDLVITDWRDLRVGDVIECVGSWEGENTNGLHTEVTLIEDISYEGDFPIQVRIPNPMHGGNLKWGLDFKFIRRPEKK